MIGRILWNDLKGNPLLVVTTWLFMAISALMFALTCFLAINLLGSVDALMETAQTPDFLQMHAGEIDEAAILQFADGQAQVEEVQILRFLNLENCSMTLGSHSLADSTQDNGVCVQSAQFDHLVDLENRVIEDVQSGEIYVPVCYRQKYGLNAGETVRIGEANFIIAGFLRDSQMNAMMASSKRFLVCAADYERLKSAGREEHLIEFLLREEADVNAFATAYADAGLPANGPAITRPLIRMMNALSDGMMVLVILLVSAVLLLISMLCIRFTLLTQLEADRKEVGMMKAIGMPKQEIRRLYFLKYLALSGFGAACGLLLAFLTKSALSAQMRELYGASGNAGLELLAAFAGAALTEGILLLSVRRTLKRTERLSAIEALSGRRRGDRPRRLISPRHVIVAFVIAAGMFLMILPQNLLSTISSPRFVTYMGIGDGEIRIDIRQTEDIAGDTRQVEALMAAEEAVERYAMLRTVSCRAVLADGSHAALQVEQGDHTVFPVSYTRGKAPESESELALSYLCAQELGLSVGDALLLSADEALREYTVCGIYSDITNGGKTAKAASLPGDALPTWSVFYASLKPEVSREQWLDAWTQRLSDRGVSARTVDIQEYVADTYAQTIRKIRMAAWAAVLAAAVVMFVVVVLFTRLLVAQERSDLSLRKALGMTGREIKRLYFIRYLPVLLAGVLAGMLSGNLLGERLAGMFLKTLGAAGLRFLVNYRAVCGWIPVLTGICVCCAVLLGLTQIKHIRAYECCMGKE